MPTRTEPCPAESLGKVAVVMGGWSAEREISLISGKAVLNALQQRGVDAVGVDATRQIAQQLSDGGYDRAFLILHGRGGEDGVVQAALELAGIPYTGSGVLASALAMDKVRAKQLCAAAGVRTPEWTEIVSEEQAVKQAEQFGCPVILKPVCEGSSIGVSKAMANQVVDAYHTAAEYGAVMMERFVEGREVTAGILGDTPLPLVSMSTPRLFYDYEAKYFSDATIYECPSPLTASTTQEIQSMALKVFQTLGARHWGRADFMVDENQVPYFIELNTAPGMTDHSLVPMAAKEIGIDFPELCLRIACMSLEEVLLRGADGTSTEVQDAISTPQPASGVIA